MRRDLANNVADTLLVRRVGEREQQADGHRVDIGLGDGLSRTSDAVLVELDLHPVRPDALGHRETQFARHEGAGRTLGEVVERGRSCRPISITSRNPWVVTSAVRAPRRSRSALVDTVVPWAIAAIDSLSSSDTSIAAKTPADSLPGRDATLAVISLPSRTATRSVKVPPTSTPTRTERG